MRACVNGRWSLQRREVTDRLENAIVIDIMCALYCSAFHLLLWVWLLDGCALQGPLQLHRPAARSATTDDVQRLLREDGAASEITWVYSMKCSRDAMYISFSSYWYVSFWIVLPSLSFSLSCSLRGGATHVYVTVTNQFIHGRSRVHDGKFRQWTYVLLWGRYVQF